MTVMPMPREKWTDERLDDLNKKVDRGFEDVKDVIADTKAEMREGFTRVDSDLRELRGDVKDLRGEMDVRFDKIDDRFEALHRVLIGSAVTIVATLIGLIGVQAF